VKLGIDPDASDADLERLAKEDDFAGRLYDVPFDGPVGVDGHRGSAFTAEVADADAELGAFRVNPGDTDRVSTDRPDTGRAVLSNYVVDVINESRAAVEDRTTEPVVPCRGSCAPWRRWPRLPNRPPSVPKRATLVERTRR
jgi:hypothetical protein